MSEAPAEPAVQVRDLVKRFRVPIDRSRSLKYRFSHLRSTSRYRELLALGGVSFDIQPGEFVGIIGANGSGKSTLLKILSGIYQPTSGEARLRGPFSPFLELGVGFNPELTARENVHVNGAILGLSRAELERRMDAILDFAELREFADQKLKNYSSGMQVRLAFTVAIQADAEILLMDEVLAVGDAAFQAKCFDVFARYRQEGKTVVLVTHDLAAVDTHCDRAILLDHGTLVADGPAASVTAQYRRRVGEAQEVQDTAPTADLANVERWGNGAIRLDAVELLDAAGRRHSNFETGRPLTVRCRLTAHRAVDDWMVGFAVHRADGVILAGTNTKIEQARLPSLEPGQELTVEYRIPFLGLLTGTYRLSLAVEATQHAVTFDHIDQGFTFRVNSTTWKAGQFDLGGEYRVVSEVRAAEG